MNLNELNTTELIQAYSRIIKQLKKCGVIRTKNLLGDLGEYLAIEHFNKTAGMSNLQAAPAGTQNIDAISRNGDRYSIKATTGGELVLSVLCDRFFDFYGNILSSFGVFSQSFFNYIAYLILEAFYFFHCFRRINLRIGLYP